VIAIVLELGGAEQVLKLALEHDQRPRNRQVDPLSAQHAVGPKFDQPAAARFAGLAERIVEHRPGVANVVGELRASVDVSKRHIVDPVERAQRDHVNGSDVRDRTLGLR